MPVIIRLWYFRGYDAGMWEAIIGVVGTLLGTIIGFYLTYFYDKRKSDGRRKTLLGALPLAASRSLKPI